MPSDSKGVQEIETEGVSSEVEENQVVCPKCNVKGPNSMYCLNCGYPLYEEGLEESSGEDVGDEGPAPDFKAKTKEEVESVSEPEDSSVVERDIQEQEEMKPQELVVEEEVQERSFIDSVRARAKDLVNKYGGFIKSSSWPLGVHMGDSTQRSGEDARQGKGASTLNGEGVSELSSDFQPDPFLMEVMESLMKSVFMKLWLVDLFKKGEVDEEQFKELFDEYEARSEKFMKCRNEMLERARNLEPVEKALNEVKVSLAELGMMRSIGEICDEEYEIKAPAFQWDIRKHKQEISKRNEDRIFLEDLTFVISKEEIDRMRTTAEECLKSMDSLTKSEKISSKTSERVKSSMEETISFLNSF